MGLLTSFGKHVKGLLGDDAFADRLAQAQAFANGDPATAARIGADLRRRKEEQGRWPANVSPMASEAQAFDWRLNPLDLGDYTNLRGPLRAGRSWQSPR